MLVTTLTREMHAARKIRRRLVAGGYEEVGEGGGKLWELYRGYRYDHRIVAVEIDPSGKSLWVKVQREK